MNLNSEIIYKTVYNLCVRANTVLPKEIYCNIKDELILENAYLARKNNRPLCQDTGMVIVFVEIGQGVSIKGEYLNKTINRAVADCYKNELYRKSVVKNALFNRTNTQDNTPAIIYTEIIPENLVRITVGIKGAGAENMSKIKMFNPGATESEIIDFIAETANLAGEKACPPYDIGIGIGGTMDYACILAKKALFLNNSKANEQFENEILKKIPNAIRVKVLTYASHIASLSVCVNLNCHSSRHATAEIKGGQVFYTNEEYETQEITPCGKENIQKVNIDELKNVKIGEKVLYSGVLYTARDAAHKKIVEDIKNGKKPPFEPKNAVIFYAGPAPSKEGEIIGPIGPTTSRRMDSYAPFLYEQGVLATIGKGEREAKGLYFTIKGGISNVIQKCVKSSEIIAYPELGTEAIRRLEVENLPLTRS